MQRHGSLAMVSPCCSSSRQITHSPASLANTSSKVQTQREREREQNMYQYAPQTPITPTAYQTQQREESSLVHYTDYRGSFLLAPMQILYLHTNAYSLNDLYTRQTKWLNDNSIEPFSLLFPSFLIQSVVAKDELYNTYTSFLHSWSQAWFICMFTIKAPKQLLFEYTVA